MFVIGRHVINHRSDQWRHRRVETFCRCSRCIDYRWLVSICLIYSKVVSQHRHVCLFVCIRRAIWNPECSFPIIIRIAFLVSRTLLLYSSETACKGALSRLLWIQYSPPVPRVVTVAFRRREKNNNRDAVAVIVDPPKAGVMKIIGDKCIFLQPCQ